MRTIRTLLVATAILAVASAGPALAAPQVNGVFDMPGVQTNGQLTAGPDGNIWVSLQDAVAKVQPDGTVTEYKAANLGNGTVLGFPSGGITSADGFVWVAQTPAGVDPIVKIPPGNPAGATSFAVSEITQGTSAMTLGPDGNIWVAIQDKLVKFSPSNPAGAMPFTFTGLQPKAIIAGSDGTLWVTDGSNGGRLLNVTTSGTLVHEPYVVGGLPQFLGAGPNGQVAYGNPNNTPQQIGLLSPGGTPQTIDRPNGSDPFGVTLGIDGAYWIAEFAGNRLARVTTDGQLTTLSGFPDASGQGPRQITAGPGNTLWATLDNPGDPAISKIARVTGLEPPPTGGGGTPPGGGGGPPGGGTPPDTTPPVVTAVSFSKTKVRVGTKSVSFRFTLNEEATASLGFSRRLPGKRRGKACIKPTRKLRKAKSCTRLVRRETIEVSATAGQNTIRLGIKSRPVGRYSATLTVVDAAGNRAAPVTRALTIAKKRR
jgi:streptogramin lyase